MFVCQAASRPLHLLFLLAPTLLAPTPTPATPQSPVLVGDFSPGTGTDFIDPGPIAEIDGRLYFCARDRDSGEEPWISDGTAAGTRQLVDLCPGSCSSSPASFTRLGNRILFSAYATRSLYALEGDELEAIGEDLISIGPLFRLGDTIYFSAGYPSVMYRTDGTREGTGITRDFCVDPSCLVPNQLHLANDAIYFEQGDRIYRLKAGGQREELAPIGGFAFTPLNERLVIFSGCADGSCTAWVTDGSVVGTHSLEPHPEIGLAVNPSRFVIWRGRAYFGNGRGQMVSTDGTVGGTLYEPSFAGIAPTPLAATPGKLFYRAAETSGGPKKLRARGASGSDVLLRESLGEFRLHSVFGPRIAFQYSTDTTSPLAISDGTSAGTFDIADSYLERPGAMLNGIYYFAFDPGGSLFGSTLWRTNGTPAGTYPLGVDKEAPHGSYIQTGRVGTLPLAQIITSGGEARNLHRIDPETFTASPLSDLALRLRHASRSTAYATVASQDGLYALTEDRVTRLSSDPVGTSVLAADGRLYFSTRIPGQKLWESDGTVPGTRELFDLLPGYVPRCEGHHCEPDYPRGITPSGSRIYFIAPGEEPSTEALWVLERGENLPRRVRPWRGYGLFSLGDGRVMYEAPTSPEPFHVSYWVDDGTPEGASIFFSEPTGYSLFPKAVAGHRLFFGLSHPTLGTTTLWVSDLTPAGTRQLNPTPFVYIDELVAADDKVFFTGKSTAGAGHEFGVSDGTPAGTRFIDLSQRAEGSRATQLSALDDGRVVFGAAGDDGAGFEPWISDGTAAGTQRLADLAPGEKPSNPHQFVQAGSTLLFVATDGSVGYELWALGLPGRFPTCPEDRLCLQADRFVARVGGETATGPFVGHRELSNESSGLFSFFSPGNWEQMIKVLDGCALNGKFWVFGAAATDVGWTLTIEDHKTGARKTYSNPSGRPAKAITDIEAFSCN